jgi:hypothetical protein
MPKNRTKLHKTAKMRLQCIFPEHCLKREGIALHTFPIVYIFFRVHLNASIKSNIFKFQILKLQLTY